MDDNLFILHEGESAPHANQQKHDNEPLPRGIFHDNASNNRSISFMSLNTDGDIRRNRRETLAFTLAFSNFSAMAL